MFVKNLSFHYAESIPSLSLSIIPYLNVIKSRLIYLTAKQRVALCVSLSIYVIWLKPLVGKVKSNQFKMVLVYKSGHFTSKQQKKYLNNM